MEPCELSMITESLGICSYLVQFSDTLSFAPVIRPDNPPERIDIIPELRREQLECERSVLNSTLKEHWRCSNCKLVLCGPIFLCYQGHLICGRCKPVAVELQTELHCPTCKESMTKLDVTAIKSTLSDLPVPCRNESLGCREPCKPDALLRHEKYCGFNNFKCQKKGCEWQGVYHIDLPAHFQNHHSENTFTSTLFLNKLGGLIKDEFDDVFMLKCKKRVYTIRITRETSKTILLFTRIRTYYSDHRLKLIYSLQFSTSKAKVAWDQKQLKCPAMVSDGAGRFEIPNNFFDAVYTMEGVQHKILIVIKTLQHQGSLMDFEGSSCGNCNNEMAPRTYSVDVDSHRPPCSNCVWKNIHCECCIMEEMAEAPIRKDGWIRCKFYEAGCMNMYNIGNVQEHEATCPYGIYRCSQIGCSWTGTFIEFPFHYANHTINIEPNYMELYELNRAIRFIYIHSKRAHLFVITMGKDLRSSQFFIFVQHVRKANGFKSSFIVDLQLNRPNKRTQMSIPCYSHTYPLIRIYNTGNFFSASTRTMNHYHDSPGGVTWSLKFRRANS